jgi:hypothetical protein
MCPPIAAATIAKLSLASTIASTGLSLMAQRNQAKAQAASQKAAAQRENARYRREAGAMRLKEAQEDLALTREIQESTKKARAARSTAVVAAGEAGVAGLSVDALLDDYTRQEAEYRFSLNEQNRLTGINNQLAIEEGVFRSEANQIRINQPIKQPDYLGSMFNLAGSGMKIYGNYNQNLLAEQQTMKLKAEGYSPK